jgi:hypothetical protein
MPTAPRRPSAQARSFTSLCECNDTKARQAFRHLDSEFTPEISTYIKLQSMRLTLGGAGRGRVALLRARRCSDRRPRSSLSLIPAFLCGCSRFLDVPRRTRGSASRSASLPATRVASPTRRPADTPTRFFPTPTRRYADPFLHPADTPIRRPADPFLHPPLSARLIASINWRSHQQFCR